MFQGWVASSLEGAGASAFLQALLADGIVGGVGAVVGFLPLVMVMYFLIALLEDCGYMARVSVVMDPIFKRVGLSGKSIIPIIISTGLRHSGHHGLPHDQGRKRKTGDRHADDMDALRSQDPGDRTLRRRVLRGAAWVSLADVFYRHRADFLWRFADQADNGTQVQKGPSSSWSCRSTRLRASAAPAFPCWQSQGLYHQGRYHHPRLQRGRTDHADLQLAV